MKKALAYLPAIPAVQRSLPPGEPAGLGTSEFIELPKSAAPIGLPGHITDPEELISSALAILAGHKPAPAPALELPLPQRTAVVLLPTPDGPLSSVLVPGISPPPSRASSDLLPVDATVGVKSL